MEAGFSPSKPNSEYDALNNGGGVVQTHGGAAGNMWSGVVKVIAQVQGGEHEIGQGKGFSRP